MLGLSEQAVGLSYVAMGVGTVTASVFGDRFTRRVGPGPSLLWGCVVCGCGWLLLALMPAGPWGVAAFALMLLLFGLGAVLIFINFLALRQAATPDVLLGRMSSTMRWLVLLPAGPGALLGGYLGARFGQKPVLLAGLLLQVIACLMLAADAAALAGLAVWITRTMRTIEPSDP